MHGWETRMLLRHYLQRGVSKAALARRFGVSRRTIHEWVETGQLDRDLSSGGGRYSPRPAVPHKLAPYTGIVEGAVKLMRGGRDDPSMARYPSSFSRHTSPHPIRRTPASEASGGAPTEVDVARLGRDSARVRGPRETAARAQRI